MIIGTNLRTRLFKNFNNNVEKVNSNNYDISATYIIKNKYKLIKWKLWVNNGDFQLINMNNNEDSIITNNINYLIKYIKNQLTNSKGEIC